MRVGVSELRLVARILEDFHAQQYSESEYHALLTHYPRYLTTTTSSRPNILSTHILYLPIPSHLHLSILAYKGVPNSLRESRGSRGKLTPCAGNPFDGPQRGMCAWHTDQRKRVSEKYMEYWTDWVQT